MMELGLANHDLVIDMEANNAARMCVVNWVPVHGI